MPLSSRSWTALSNAAWSALMRLSTRSPLPSTCNTTARGLFFLFLFDLTAQCDDMVCETGGRNWWCAAA